MSRVLRTLALAVLLGAPLCAQDPLPFPDENAAPTPAEIEVLRQRCTPAPPTPATPSASSSAQQVDVEAAHERALALYETGALYAEPLPAPGSGAPAWAEEPSAPAADAAHPEAAPWALLAGFVVSVLLIGWFLLRVRPALAATESAAEPEQAPLPATNFAWKPQRRSRPMKPVWPVQPPHAPLPQQPPNAADAERVARERRQR